MAMRLLIYGNRDGCGFNCIWERCKRMDSKEIEIGRYWDKQQKEKVQKAGCRLRWWDSPHIIRHYNYRACGKYLDGWNAGPLQILNCIKNDACLQSAISIGCGTGTKEMMLIEQGIVKKFICYELSGQRIIEGKRIAAEKGISDAIEFHLGNFFSSDDNLAGKYDLIFGDNSIHHMLDTRSAVRRSKEILKDGGFFFCNDFVGANRFQWTELELAIINGIRLQLPEDIFQSGNKKLKRFVQRPDLDKMMQTDYSEAADSENIIPSVQDVFQDPLIRNIGGVIFHTCLNDILQNIPENSILLNHLLSLDAEAADHGFSQYAFVLAQKK